MTWIRFERELEALRKELAEAQSKSQHSSPTMDPSEVESEPVSPLLSIKSLAGEEGVRLEIPTTADVDFSLELEETKKEK
jgi:hypothetical protein